MKDHNEISFTVQNGPNIAHCSTACCIVRSDLTLDHGLRFSEHNSGSVTGYPQQYFMKSSHANVQTFTKEINLINSI